MIIRFIDVILLSYLLGDIPTGAIVGKLMGGKDVTRYGSGKIGTANVLRTIGIRAAVITGLGDIAKSSGAVWLAKPIIGTGIATVGTVNLDVQSAQAMAGLFAIIGHNWPIFLKFRGGSGVTAFFGGLLVCHWPTSLLGGSIVLLILAGTRYFSLGSMIGTVCATVTILVLVLMRNQPVEYLIYTGIATGLILFKHRDNIRRLKAGTERKLGERATGIRRPHPPRR